MVFSVYKNISLLVGNLTREIELPVAYVIVIESTPIIYIYIPTQDFRPTYYSHGTYILYRSLGQNSLDILKKLTLVYIHTNPPCYTR